jgi:hypothetical protein
MNENALRLVQITRKDNIREEEFDEMLAEMRRIKQQSLLPSQILYENLSHLVAENFITPKDAPIPDCLTCGACCSAALCVGVRASDNPPPGTFWNVTTETAKNGEVVVDSYLKRNPETLYCEQLEGEIGDKIGCRIYDERPSTCRIFEAGSDKCHAFRRAHGIEPFLSLDEMMRANDIIESKDETKNPAEIIYGVRYIEQTETGFLDILAIMEDETIKTLHSFNPQTEKWRQFEFAGLSWQEANELIAKKPERI